MQSEGQAIYRIALCLTALVDASVTCSASSGATCLFWTSALDILSIDAWCWRRRRRRRPASSGGQFTLTQRRVDAARKAFAFTTKILDLTGIRSQRTTTTTSGESACWFHARHTRTPCVRPCRRRATHTGDYAKVSTRTACQAAPPPAETDSAPTTDACSRPTATRLPCTRPSCAGAPPRPATDR